MSGIESGYTVYSNGAGKDAQYMAGGFVAESASAEISNSTVEQLRQVKADNEEGHAGGFIGVSHTGGLAEVAANDSLETSLELLKIDGLLSAVTYMVPKYTNCTVSYSGYDEEDEKNSFHQVEASSAGGFAGKLESGTIDNSSLSDGSKTAVWNVKDIYGRYFAGGFAGFATSGALVESKGGISLLGLDGINLNQILSVIQAYVPKIICAGVSSVKPDKNSAQSENTDDLGLKVTVAAQIQNLEQAVGAEEEEVKDTKLFESNSGSAGGFLGYGSGVQIENSSVSELRHTQVKEPEELDQKDGSSYFGKDSTYAIKAPRYAGGYVGKLDIGNAASVGKGLGALKIVANLEDLLGVLDAVCSSIKNSDVCGEAGGYAVLADGIDSSKTDKIGHAGGYAGSVNGSLIENSNAHKFAYIIGQETAGGFAGNAEPGNVAELLGSVDVLKGLISIDNLLNGLQTFIVRIHNSNVDSVPCGGVVRAESAAGEKADGILRMRGIAGGYIGHNYGATIKDSKVDRIRSVYGYEYAGGFDGYMENASLADTGSLSLLYGLIKVDNPLAVGQVVYGIEENTEVNGPLRNLTFAEFKNWYEKVGNKSPYAKKFECLVKGTEENYNAKISNYYYGYEVTAGRDVLESGKEKSAGIAGGYVGKMVGSQITNAKADDLKKVTAMRSAGGFAGEAAPGSR